MQAALFEPGHQVAVRTVDLPPMQPGGALLRVRACGICGSDLHTLRGNRPPKTQLGHEIAAEVLDVDSGAGLRAGDHVAVEPFVSCGQCTYCLSGNYNHCSTSKFVGYSLPGGYAEYLQLPAAHRLHKLPADLPWDQSALTEPLAVGVHALRIAGIAHGMRVVVAGAGTIGLMALQAAKAMGATTTGVLAKYPHQAALALALGADVAVLTSEPDAVQRLTSELGGGADIVIEAVGAQSLAPVQALDAARHLGTVVLTGVFTGEVPVNFATIVNKEIRLLGSNCYSLGPDQRRDFEVAIALLASGQVRAEPVITHRYPLSRAPEAFATSLDKHTGVVKAILLA
jgi:2-desacetyl-2-hydroxyethyl bacteriochlorophyllide A dehydrogenase